MYFQTQNPFNGTTFNGDVLKTFLHSPEQIKDAHSDCFYFTL